MAGTGIIGAGQLFDQVRFERRGSPGADEFGNTQGEWAALYTCRARLQPKPISGSAAENILAGRLAGRAQWTIVVRGCAESRAVTVLDRAVDTRTGQVLNIRSILNLDERGTFLTMDAESGVEP